MRPYDILVHLNLKGSTPKQEFENLLKMKELLRIVAYPARGTIEEDLSIYGLATMVQDKFTVDDLEEKS